MKDGDARLYLGGDLINARRKRKLEPWQHFPIGADEHVKRVGDLELLVSHMDAHRHLPVLDLRPSA